jgi:hypothetical protein
MTLHEAIDVALLFSYLVRRELVRGQLVSEAVAEQAARQLATAAAHVLDGLDADHPPAELSDADVDRLLGNQVPFPANPLLN